MSVFFLSIGSNMAPDQNIPACLKALKNRFDVKKISNIYETDPVGPAGDKKFWNLVVGIETSLDANALAKALHEIETQLGRKRDPENKFAPRVIDIDILPQTDYQHQAFIMIPLAEIAPHVVDKETGKSFEALAETLKEEAQGFQKIDL